MTEKPSPEQQKQLERAEEIHQQIERAKAGHRGKEDPKQKSLREQIEERSADKQKKGD